MPAFSTVQRFGALCVIGLCLLPARSNLLAQTDAPATAVPAQVIPAKTDEFNQSELLESYRHVQEQLRLTQSAIVKNRLDAEAIAMAQSAAFAEKLDTIQSLMAAEHRRQQVLSERAEFERARQEAELQQSHHTVLWAAAAFGAVGLLTMLLAARLQWRTINRLAEAGDLRLQLPASARREMMPQAADIPSEHTVAQSTQRMMSAISRMERRIFELENSAHPLPTARPNPVGSSEKALV